MSDLFDGLDEAERERRKQSRFPEWMDPMLAKLTDRRFSDDEWIFERKLDGERCLAFVRGDDVRLRSRNRQDLNGTYPELVEALADQAGEELVADGEIVAFSGNRTSFERLQKRMQIEDPEAARATRVAVFYYLFDLLWIDGYDVTELPLRARKTLLRAAIGWQRPLRFTRHRNRDGESFYEEACEKGWEGLIAKRATSTYQHSRSADWLKFKCVDQQELVIGGYTDPEGARIGFGALLVGYYRDGDLIYAGKVGTGFDEEALRSLADSLRSRERTSPPFDVGDLPTRGVHWVAPDLVGEVGFTEWTREGKLRHPRFLGLRRDKDAEDVVREEPEA